VLDADPTVDDLQVTLDELASLMYFVIGIVLIAIAASPRYRHLFVRKTKAKEAVTLVRRLTISSSGRSRVRKEWDAAVASATHDAVDVVYMEKERRLQTAAAEETLEGHSDGNGTAAPLSPGIPSPGISSPGIPSDGIPSPGGGDSTVLSELLASHREVVKMLAAMDNRITEGLKQRPKVGRRRPKVDLDPLAQIALPSHTPSASPARAADDTAASVPMSSSMVAPLASDVFITARRLRP